VTQSSALLALLDEPVWFCLKAQPKREHLAAIALRRQFGIECFSPRLRFRKMTNRGPVWFVEAMFPGYLFTKFVYSKQHRAVEASHGVRRVCWIVRVEFKVHRLRDGCSFAGICDCLERSFAHI
jgi:Transcription termination factor nusG